MKIEDFISALNEVNSHPYEDIEDDSYSESDSTQSDVSCEDSDDEIKIYYENNDILRDYKITIIPQKYPQKNVTVFSLKRYDDHDLNTNDVRQIKDYFESLSDFSFIRIIAKSGRCEFVAYTTGREPFFGKKYAFPSFTIYLFSR
jgi:hypothetical protein